MWGGVLGLGLGLGWGTAHIADWGDGKPAHVASGSGWGAVGGGGGGSGVPRGFVAFSTGP